MLMASRQWYEAHRPFSPSFAAYSATCPLTTESMGYKVPHQQPHQDAHQFNKCSNSIFKMALFRRAAASLLPRLQRFQSTAAAPLATFQPVDAALTEPYKRTGGSMYELSMGKVFYTTRRRRRREEKKKKFIQTLCRACTPFRDGLRFRVCVYAYMARLWCSGLAQWCIALH